MNFALVLHVGGTGASQRLVTPLQPSSRRPGGCDSHQVGSLNDRGAEGHGRQEEARREEGNRHQVDEEGRAGEEDRRQEEVTAAENSASKRSAVK